MKIFGVKASYLISFGRWTIYCRYLYRRLFGLQDEVTDKVMPVWRAEELIYKVMPFELHEVAKILEDELLSRAIQIKYRTLLCADCYAAGKCYSCGCKMPESIEDGDVECSEQKWFTIVPYDQWYQWYLKSNQEMEIVVLSNKSKLSFFNRQSWNENRDSLISFSLKLK